MSHEVVVGKLRTSQNLSTSMTSEKVENKAPEECTKPVLPKNHSLAEHVVMQVDKFLNRQPLGVLCF